MRNDVTSMQILPGVFMMTDRMGMHMTLLVGKEKALLVDCGYGFDDLNAAVRAITSLPVTVLLTHGHHDHACGACQFDRVLLHEEELPVFAHYAGTWRKRVWQQATQKGLDLTDWTEEAFTCRPAGNGQIYNGGVMNLGGLTARVMHSPGHTKGSLCVYVEEEKLLLPGDALNPTTWIFFPECEGLGILTKTLERLSALPFEQVLCPHFDRLLPRTFFDDFKKGLVKEKVLGTSTPAFQLWEGKKVYACHPTTDTTLCYDYDKLPKEWTQPVEI